MLGDVRHNFHLNQDKNELVSTLWKSDPRKKDISQTDEGRQRMIYVVGQLIAAETILRNAANATDGEDDYATELGELLLSVFDNLVEIQSLEDATADLEDLGGLLADGDLDPDDTSELIEAADKLKAVAMKIADGDGSELDEVKIPEISTEHLNKAYQPQ